MVNEGIKTGNRVYSGHLGIDKTVALCGMIWFVFIIDACFTCFISWKLRYIIGAPFVFYATFLLWRNNGLVFTQRRRIFFFSFVLWIFLGLFGKFEIVASTLQWMPLLCIFFWRNTALLKMYEYFKKFILFYAVVSIVVEVLVLTKTWTAFPYIVFPPQDNVQEELGYVNYFFGLYNVQATDTSSVFFYRACGPGREGGHFAIYLGFLYFSENVIFKKRNLLLIICGILTISPNFIIALLITEGCRALREKQLLKPLFIILSFMASIVIGFIILPQSIKDEIVYVVLERSLMRNVENTESDGIMALFDGRTGGRGAHDYATFLKKGTYTKLVGVEEMPEYNVMSDTRFLIMRYGYIGTILTIWYILMLSIYYQRNLFGLCLFFIALLILLHRVWMFFHPYWYVTMLLIVTVKQCYVGNKIFDKCHK